MNIKSKKEYNMQKDTGVPTATQTGMPSSHPFLARITMSPVDLYRAALVASRTADYNLIGYDDEFADGKITVYVACASVEVAESLSQIWWQWSGARDLSAWKDRAGKKFGSTPHSAD